jgi:hypothetical protein
MKHASRWLAAFAVCVGGAAQASTIGVQGAPELSIYWNNGIGGPDRLVTTTPVVFDVDEQTGDFSTGSQSYSWTWRNPQTGLFETDTITLNFAGGNFDPVVVLAVGFVDVGAPSVFTFGVSAPLAVAGPVSYKLDLSGSFSDGASDGGSMGLGMAPPAPDIMDGQLDFVSVAGIGTPLAGFTPGGNSTFSFPSVLGSTTCGAGCTDFGLLLSAKGSGGGDGMSFTGRFEITPVPVPTAIWLLGSALGVLGYLRRRSA